MTAAHSLVYAFGYIFAFGGFTGTVLYVGIGGTPSTQAFGVVLILTGSLLMFAFARNNPKTIRVATVIQSLAWLYASMIYILNSTWMFALGISLPWALLAWYIGYAFSRRVDIMAYDRTPQAEWDTAHEDK